MVVCCKISSRRQSKFFIIYFSEKISKLINKSKWSSAAVVFPKNTTWATTVSVPENETSQYFIVAVDLLLLFMCVVFAIVVVLLL